jgi:hypothetical protein
MPEASKRESLTLTGFHQSFGDFILVFTDLQSDHQDPVILQAWCVLTWGAALRQEDVGMVP